MVLLANEQAALAELRDWLQQRFGTRLDRLLLFGSRARGEGSDDSDLDVLVVVQEMTSAEGREIAHFCGGLLTQHDALVAPFALSRERFDRLRQRERRIAIEITRDGVPL